MDNKERILSLQSELTNNILVNINKFEISPFIDRQETERSIGSYIRRYSRTGGHLFDISEKVWSFFYGISDLDIVWTSKHDIYESRILFYSLPEIINSFVTYYWKNSIWFDDMEEPLKSQLQSLLPFDWYNGHEGQGACLRLIDGEVTDDVWIYDEDVEEKMYRFDGTLQEYFDLMIDCKGFKGWQMAAMFPTGDERKTFVENFPKIFPDVDISLILEKFKKYEAKG